MALDDIPSSTLTPPAPFPGERDPFLPLMMAKAITRSIDGWPRQVFEQAAWRPPFPGAVTFIMDPDALKVLFVEQASAFTQGAMFRRMMRPVWGEGILTSEGAKWRWQRHAGAPAFRPAQMHALAPSMSGVAEAALVRWRSSPRIDLPTEAARITFDVILDTMLSGGDDFDRDTASARIEAFTAQVGKMKLSYFFAPDAHHEDRLNPPTAAGEALRGDIAAMVRRRRAAPPRGDLLDLLLAARDPETGQAMDDEILRDNILGFIMAGHQTSSVALTWSLYLASAHEPTARRLRAEVAAVAGDQPIGPDHVENLVFTRQVIQEAMRLYPPAFQLYRICTRTTEVGGIAVRAGQRILIPIYALHRHRRWWRDPDAFDPDRFGPGQPMPDRHLYMPFGAGPRICLGAAFAMTELVVMLATLMRGATFTVAPGHRVWPRANLTILPEGGLPMDVVLRS
ncbi:cytochrome P450 [Phenylobacterium sp.]|uniref:cytochrome P450 n=1 Tax=Phenylobacterium sp. TaxID=1871053 RepID=UPI0025F5FF11|nr:cytochrome P450 [Phenylobacterium sp.]